MTTLSLNQLVLSEFLELSESSIYFSNASGRFLSIPDKKLPEYEVLVLEYPAGIFFSFISMDITTNS